MKRRISFPFSVLFFCGIFCFISLLISCSKEDEASLFKTRSATNKIGSSAPKLQIAEWIQGNPVDVTDGNNLYIVEFWATWCPSCRASIPHLNELQQKYSSQGVVIIGISGEESQTIRSFVKKQASKMTYRIAQDKSQRTSELYMATFGQTGIPTVFLIDRNSQIIWIGHPMQIEPVLQQVLSGKYNMASMSAEMELQEQIDAYREIAELNLPEKSQFVDKLLNKINTNTTILNDLMNAAFYAHDIESFEKTARRYAAADPEFSLNLEGVIENAHFKILQSAYIQAIEKSIDLDSIKNAEKQLFSHSQNNPDELQELAEMLIEMGQTNFLNKTLSVLSSLGEESAKQAEELRIRSQLMNTLHEYILTLRKQSNVSNNDVETISKHRATLEETILNSISSQVSQSTLYQIISQLCWSMGKNIPIDFSFKLLEKGDQLLIPEPTLPPSDILRATLWYFAGNEAKGDEYAKMTLDSIQDERMKEEIHYYLHSAKQSALEKNNNSKSKD